VEYATKKITRIFAMDFISSKIFSAEIIFLNPLTGFKRLNLGFKGFPVTCHFT